MNNTTYPSLATAAHHLMYSLSAPGSRWVRRASGWAEVDADTATVPTGRTASILRDARGRYSIAIR